MECNAIPVLFHGSCRLIHDHLVPRPQATMTKIHGEFVFAQPHKDLAQAYALKTNDVFLVGKIDGEIIVYVRDEKSFLEDLKNQDSYGRNSLGGYVYTVSGAFELVPDSDDEYVSKEKAPIVHREFVSLASAIQQGVQIYILNDRNDVDFMKDKNPREVAREIDAGLCDKARRLLLPEPQGGRKAFDGLAMNVLSGQPHTLTS